MRQSRSLSVDVLLHEVAHKLVDALAVGRHLRAAELDFGLRLKHRLLHVDGYCGHDTVADVGVFVVFVEKFLDGAGDMLLECALVRTALRGVLTVDEAVILLAILVGMCEGNLDILAHDVDDGVEFRHGHVVLQQVLQSVAALDAPSVVHDGEPRVQIGVVAKHRLHKLLVGRWSRR